MLKHVTILGSTGSIGKSALDVIRNSDELAVFALSANDNIELLEQQIKEFKPKAAAVRSRKVAEAMEKICEQKGYDTTIYKGDEGVGELAALDGADIVLIAVVGNAGIKPTLAAIEAGKTIALANKEALVSAGELILKNAKEKNVQIIPVDSEHSAIFQCLQGNPTKHVHKLIITASGGAFRGYAASELKKVKASEALKHPTWDMGNKITIDSATLMNKGLEVIEAHWLFGIPLDRIDTIVHPQSIVHSMVEFTDGSVLAQMATTDMRFPIHYALHYPERPKNPFPKLNLLEINKLTFEEPDFKNFPCLRLAYEALKIGGTMPCVLNEVNQALVNLFLRDEIMFYDIPEIIEIAMKEYKPVTDYTLADLEAAGAWAKEFLVDRMGSGKR